MKNKQGSKLKIVITGGHHNSALVIAKKLLELGADVEWIGHRYSSRGDTHDSAEYIEVTGAGISFHNLVAGKTALTLRNFVNIPLGFGRAIKLVSRLKPDAVLSFGGYLGLAVSVGAAVKNIPLFLHEQTAIAGKANKLASRLARKIFLTWKSSRKYYPRHKSLVIGLPLRPSFLTSEPKKLFDNDKPTVLFLCGKQGSHAINKLIFSHLDDLLTHYNLIHQTGTSSVTRDFDMAVALKESLSGNLAMSYKPRGYIGEAEIAGYMKSVQLVVGRSGAHSTYELGILGKKCILIPLMTTHGREQFHNARLLESAGIATILPQSVLSFPALAHEIDFALKRTEPKPLDLPTDAADTLIREMTNTLS